MDMNGFSGRGARLEQGRAREPLQPARLDAMFRHARERYSATVRSARRPRALHGRQVLRISVIAGDFARQMHPYGSRVVVLDPRVTALVSLVQACIAARCCCAHEMSFANSSFHVAVVARVLEHTEPDLQQFNSAETVRPLAPGGRVLATFRTALRPFAPGSLQNV